MDTALDILRNVGTDKLTIRRYRGACIWQNRMSIDADGSPTNPYSDRYYSPNTSLKPNVDALTVPYIVMGRDVLAKCAAHLGDIAVVYNTATGQYSAAIVADTHRGRAREGSVALAERIGVPHSPVSGGADGGIVYCLFPGAASGWPATGFEGTAEGLLADVGGVDRIVRVNSGALDYTTEPDTGDIAPQDTTGDVVSDAGKVAAGTGGVLLLAVLIAGAIYLVLS